MTAFVKEATTKLRNCEQDETPEFRSAAHSQRTATRISTGCTGEVLLHDGSREGLVLVSTRNVAPSNYVTASKTSRKSVQNGPLQ